MHEGPEEKPALFPVDTVRQYLRDTMRVRRAFGILKSRITYDYKPFSVSRMKRFYRAFVRDGSLCFDLGAHTGDRSAAWLALNARVVAVEPHPVFAELMRKRFASKPDFSLVEKAVSDKDGTASLRISYSNPAVSTISDAWMSVISGFDGSTSWDEAVDIGAVTLDSLIGMFGVPDFCKIDVEGSEEAVLSGCSSALPALSFEFFPGEAGRAVSCLDILESTGRYRYNAAFTEQFMLVHDTWVDRERMERFLRGYTGRKSGDVYAVIA